MPHAARSRNRSPSPSPGTGELYFDKEKINSPADIAFRLASKENADGQVSVVINADRAVEYGKVIDLMDAVRQAGVSRIAVAVTP